MRKTLLLVFRIIGVAWIAFWLLVFFISFTSPTGTGIDTVARGIVLTLALLGAVPFAFRAGKAHTIFGWAGIPRASFRQAHIDRDVRMLIESYNICTTSTNFDTVVSRLSFGRAIADRINDIHDARLPENIGIWMTYFLSCEEEVLSDALMRCYKKEKQDAAALKTEKGRANRLTKFIGVMEPRIAALSVDTDTGEAKNGKLMQALLAIQAEVTSMGVVAHIDAPARTDHNSAHMQSTQSIQGYRDADAEQ